MKRSGLIAMIALTVLPIIATGLAVLLVLPDTIPVHAGLDGIDQVGSKYEAFILAFIVASCGVLLTVMYAFMDKLAALGLVHGTDAHGGRITTLVCQALVDVMQLAALIWMSFGV